MITIENSRKYAPINEKLAMVDKITSLSQLIDDNGIVNGNWLKIVSTCFFVGLYTQDQNITTDDYDEIIQNRIDIDLKVKLDETEVIEWEEILKNAIDYEVEKRKNAKTNVMAAVVSLLQSFEKNTDPKNSKKAAKTFDAIYNDPDKRQFILDAMKFNNGN
jgi:hypothetical protein